MLSSPIFLPASALMRPEKTLKKENLIDRVFHRIFGFASGPFTSLALGNEKFVSQVHKHTADLDSSDESAFSNKILELRIELLKSGYNKERLALAFALIQEATNIHLGMRHFDVQLIGGLAMFYGKIAEMNTGEGKTLTAILPAAAAALQGISVHVITVNDYLAQRDADEMRGVYELLGLSVGCIVHGLSPQERRTQYACNVVYCTNNELVFDYLKDSIVLDDRHHYLHLHAEKLKNGEKVEELLLLQGLHYAIIDEADSVLMDEARTPLIISGEENHNPQQEKMYRLAIETAAKLVENIDYKIDYDNYKVTLTDTGKEIVYDELKELGGFWRSQIRTYELICQALSALYIYVRDKHYLIREGKVQIIDEHTGRIMENRSWERGLHQMIEIKEDCEITKPRTTLARISYQNFFRKYFHLCGMTGTAKEVANEFWTTYGLRVLKIPTHKPCIRIRNPVNVVETEEKKWTAILERVQMIHEQGQPILIGTHSVLTSEIMSNLLNETGLEHELLNAKQDQDEAGIIAQAGAYGQITIATNMAGRGTDIKLTDQVRHCGGLYVILSELHDAARIDRQLEGRCARQGDPGFFEMILSAEDQLMKGVAWTKIYALLIMIIPNTWISEVAYMLMKLAQKSVEKKHRTMRVNLLKYDEKQNTMLSFSGRNT